MEKYKDKDNLNERSTEDFLVYANSVNTARAIPLVEDNLKPIHRKILYTFYITGLTSDKKYAKSMATVGEVMKSFSPHGDSATYEALARLAQSWKLRYPLVSGHGNYGNLLGDGPAAARYTDAKLSPIGDMMLEGINQDCVDFVPNYSETTTEPVTLPSKFPFLLCGNNSGIGVSLSSDIVSHNFTEVKAAIEYYLDHKDCTIADLMRFIPGPDFPTGGRITNGEDLLQIYSTGRGSIKMQAHYDIIEGNNKNAIVFHDLPYGVEIEKGVKTPLKKLILDEGYEQFTNIDISKTRDNFFDITITLDKKANVAQCLNLLLTKTSLADSVKVNNTVIAGKEIKTLNLKQMIESYVNYRSNVIKRIAENNYTKNNHKLTVIIGLQKCMSDIDKLISLIRNADSRSAAKTAIKSAFELNDEQADAVLDMKLSRLNRLDMADLNRQQSEIEDTLRKLKERINDEQVRYQVIREDLAEIKKVVGEDKRLTEIVYSKAPSYTTADGKEVDLPTELAVKKNFVICDNGDIRETKNVDRNVAAVVNAYSANEICFYNAKGEIGHIIDNPIGVFCNNKKKMVSVTKGGLIKCSTTDSYKLGVTNKPEKVMKVKDGDEVVFVTTADDNDFIYLVENSTSGDEPSSGWLKLAVKDLAVASKATIGVKSGVSAVCTACCASNDEMLLVVDADFKGKLVRCGEISVNSRGNKPQNGAKEKVIYITNFSENVRDELYAVPVRGNTFTIARGEIKVKTIKNKGVALSSRKLVKIV